MLKAHDDINPYFNLFFYLKKKKRNELHIIEVEVPVVNLNDLKTSLSSLCHSKSLQVWPDLDKEFILPSIHCLKYDAVLPGRNVNGIKVAWS